MNTSSLKKVTFNFLRIVSKIVTPVFLSLMILITPFSNLVVNATSYPQQNSCEYTNTISFNDSLINWSKQGKIKYFNPALGTLTSLTIKHSSALTIVDKAENLGDLPAVVSGQVGATSTLSFPAHVSEVYFVKVIGPDNVGPADGVVDYSGTGGITTSPSTLALEDAPIIITDSSELSAYINSAAGGVDFTESVVGTQMVVASGAVVNLDIVSTASSTIAVTYKYSTSNPCSTPNDYCANGVELTYPEFASAKLAGLISHTLSYDLGTHLTTAVITNTTGCTFPASLSVYRMFDTTLSHQQLFDSTPIIQVGPTSTLTAHLPSCMAQIDLWYGLAPTVLLDSNPYGAPPPPVVFGWTFTMNSGTGYAEAAGEFCADTVNTPPVITLVGSNPITIIQNHVFTDPGATATDTEDGNLTPNIFVTGTVSTSTVGSYALTYKITDSGGLSASTTRNVIVIPNDYCANGVELTYPEFASAKLAGLISHTLSYDLGTHLTTAVITNTTGCTFPASLSVYRMFDTTLSHQQLFDSTPIINVGPTSTLTAHLPSCMAQIDLWYGLAPTVLLDSNPYGAPPPPVVFGWTFTMNSGTGYAEAAGEFCTGADSIPLSVNLGVTISANKTTLPVLDTVTYTINVTNAGPDSATGVALTDVLPSSLEFISAIPAFGTFSTSTNIWTIGTLTSASTTSMVVVAKVKAGTEGQTITNGVSVSSVQVDTDSSNNTASVNVSVNPVVVNNPPASTGCTSNCGGGGGGGGGNGPPISLGGGGGGVSGPVVLGKVLGAFATSSQNIPKSCVYLFDHLKKGWNNNPVEVKKLQVFLRDFEGNKNLPITEVYDDATIVAVDTFQDKYKDEVLTPWGLTGPTDFTYITTKKKVNEIYCQRPFPVTAPEQQEIEVYKEMITSGTSMLSDGQSLGNELIEDPNVISDDESIGSDDTSTTTVGTTNEGFVNFAGSIILKPWKWIKSLFSKDE